VDRLHSTSTLGGDVRDEYGVERQGVNTITAEQASALLDDARYQSDPTDAGADNRSLRTAYGALVRQLAKRGVR
jgi:hypothetical protein